MVTEEMFRELLAVVKEMAPPSGRDRLTEIEYALNERCSLALARRKMGEWRQTLERGAVTIYPPIRLDGA